MQKHVESRTPEPLLPLVAGPYRSGADDVAERLEANVEPMNRAALEEAGKLVVSQAAELP
jgi:hypothetical protein